MSKYKGISSFWILCAFVGVLVYSCANRGYPEGGPKDVTPPKVIMEDPVSFTRNFDKKSVKVYFDEYVQLKEINEKFIISPPLKKKPRVSLRGKYILVDLSVDTLKPNTTYSLDFADAIVDNNEGNPLGYYRYVLSTGNEIDSLELSGNVVEAESGAPLLNMYVFLYKEHTDSIPLLHVPDYIARTDSSGFFRLTNLKNDTYKILAVEDNNRDYKLTPGERIGFLDSLIHPVVIPMTRTDTLTRIVSITGRDTVRVDSIETKDFLAYGPNNLYIRLFEEKPTQLYLVDDARKERERLDFVFSIPGKNDFNVTLKDTIAENWFVPEYSAGKDSITYWISDSLLYKKDTLNLILSYLRTDSTNQRTMFRDTIRSTFTDKKVAESRGKKKNESQTPPIKFLTITPGFGNEFDVNGRLSLLFDRPIDKQGLKQIQLLEKVDTIFKPVTYTIREDSVKIRQIYLDAKLEPEKEYMVKLDSARVYDIYGHHNNKFEKTFKVRSLEYYGNLALNVVGTDGRNVIVQLYKSDKQSGSKNSKGTDTKQKFNILREALVNQDGQVKFDLLEEGVYGIRAILDENRNGKWDTGLYMKRVQPEEIIYAPFDINIKQNFDLEQEFDLIKSYK